MAKVTNTHPALRVNTVDTPGDHAGELPYVLPIQLTVCDSATIAELCAHSEGADREEFALDALRIGVLALKQVRGQIDADAVRRESERLLESLDAQLGKHAEMVHERLTSKLKEYFDPNDGHFHQRVERLVKQDGDLELVMRRQIGREDSELDKTLSDHFGVDSPLMKYLSPDQSKGLLCSLRETLDGQLKSQREHVLNQFSLDNKDGALSRFISELTERQGVLSDEMNERIDEVVREFSLDDDNSSLSRLVKNVERAQKTITREFSLDEENSALARLKRELMELLEKDRETNQKFQEEVKGTLQAMIARKQEAERSTRHGLEFEDAVFENVQYEAQRVGDVATKTGNTTGRIKNCKVGDCLVELGPESAAPGARIAIEAKEKAAYDLAEARDEIEKARKNRDAQIGLFVFSKRTASESLEPLARYGNDIVVVWDAEDATSDLYLKTAYTLARALCVRSRKHQEDETADFEAIDKAILEIEKRVGSLDEIKKWAETIQSNSGKILKTIETSRKSLEQQVELLREKTGTLKELHTFQVGGEA